MKSRLIRWSGDSLDQAIFSNTLDYQKVSMRILLFYVHHGGVENSLSTNCTVRRGSLVADDK